MDRPAIDRPATDRILISGLVVRCIVGLYRFERQAPQPVQVDLTLHADVERAGLSDRLRDTVDYGKLCGDVRFLLEAAQHHLLESACEAVARYALTVGPAGRREPWVEAVTVRLSKRRALGDSAIPSVEVHRRRSEIALEVEDRPFGAVDVIYASRDCGIYRLRIAPGRAIPTHVHRVMDESELVQTDGLLLQGLPAQEGSARRWPKDFPHRYDNPTEREQAILCVDRPSFIPADEILVDDPPEPLDRLETRQYYDPRAYVEPSGPSAAEREG